MMVSSFQASGGVLMPRDEVRILFGGTFTEARKDFLPPALRFFIQFSLSSLVHCLLPPLIILQYGKFIDVVRLFLRPLKTLIDYAPALINTWNEDVRKQQATALVLQIKSKHFIDVYNCVKALSQGSGDAAAFRYFLRFLLFCWLTEIFDIISSI
jgi:hypothetical protein